MSGKELRQQILSPASLVPASMLGLVAVSAFAVANTLYGIETRLTNIEKSLWTFPMQRDYQTEIADRSPNLKGINLWEIRERNLTN